MKQIVLLSILFLYAAIGYTQPAPISKVRLLYQKAVTEEKACKKLIKLLKPYDQKNSPLFLGYKGSATMMMAKHVLNPFAKLSYFKRGKEMLAKAVEANSQNIELRFLRYVAQTNAPSFLGYNEYISEDKAFLLQSKEQVTDIAVKEFIRAKLNLNTKD